MLLIGAGLLLWFNYVGLPGFVQAPILKELQQHHFDLRLGKIRLQGFRQLVAENISFKGNAGRGETRFHIENAELVLNSSALRRFNFQLEALDIRQGRLEMPLSTPTNGLSAPNAPEMFVVDRISTRLALGAADTWRLENFRGDALGLELNASGAITNISQMAGPGPSGKKTNAEANIRQVISRVTQELNKFEFATPPRLWLQFHGDAKSVNAWSANFTLRSSSAKTDWGSAENLEIVAGLAPRGTNSLEVSAFGSALPV
ncbi:MAG: hypothetical protein ACO1QB_04925, partial [Verrucomicrobiales bacterium]